MERNILTSAMRHLLLPVIVLFALASTLEESTAATPEAKFGTRSISYMVCQMIIPEYEMSASNIYEAVNKTLQLVIKRDPRVADLEIVIGPMAPRATDAEKTRKMMLKNENLMTILRYWAELYQFSMHFDGRKIVFDGKPRDDYRDQEDLLRKIEPGKYKADK